MKRILPLIAILILGCLLGTTGCPRRGVRGWGVQSASWGIGDPDAIDGLDNVSLQIGTLGGRPALVIWSASGEGFSANWDAGRGMVHYEGNLTGPNGTRWVVECYTLDGRSGPVRIAGQAFDLRGGSWFFVDTSSNPPRVRQLARKLPVRLESDPESDNLSFFQQMAREDAEIWAFYLERPPEAEAMPQAGADDPDPSAEEDP